MHTVRRLPSIIVLAIAGGWGAAAAQESPPFLRDRGDGVPSSMFGTFIGRGQLLVYPFFEYYLDDDMEYSPAELGYGLDEDFRGGYRASEGVLFFGYGISDWLAIELEASVISASLETAPDDPSATPARIEESGIGDVEGQLRARIIRETEGRPEVFSYVEWVAPTQPDKVLIGTSEWEFKAGFGVTRGFRWGTASIRLAAEYSLEESVLEVGEYAFEYLKRVSPAWRIYLGVEGSQDEVELIPQAEWQFARGARLRLNSAFGLTSKATDWAPEVGVMFTFGGPRHD